MDARFSQNVSRMFPGGMSSGSRVATRRLHNLRPERRRLIQNFPLPDDDRNDISAGWTHAADAPSTGVQVGPAGTLGDPAPVTGHYIFGIVAWQDNGATVPTVANPDFWNVLDTQRVTSVPPGAPAWSGVVIDHTVGGAETWPSVFLFSSAPARMASIILDLSPITVLDWHSNPILYSGTTFGTVTITDEGDVLGQIAVAYLPEIALKPAGVRDANFGGTGLTAGGTPNYLTTSQGFLRREKPPGPPVAGQTIEVDYPAGETAGIAVAVHYHRSPV